MTYKDVAPVPVECEEALPALRDAYRRLALQFNDLLDDIRAIKSDLRNATKLQDTDIATTSPSDNQVLTFDASTGKWTPETP